MFWPIELNILKVYIPSCQTTISFQNQHKFITQKIINLVLSQTFLDYLFINKDYISIDHLKTTKL